MFAIKDQLITMVERRASKGHNFDQSMELLLELCNAHSGNNLATALVYQGYATEKQASRFTDAELDELGGFEEEKKDA